MDTSKGLLGNGYAQGMGQIPDARNLHAGNPSDLESLPAKREGQSLDPTKRDASKEEFGHRTLAGGNMWESL